jgi:maleate cis-trans isomerase
LSSIIFKISSSSSEANLLPSATVNSIFFKSTSTSLFTGGTFY